METNIFAVLFFIVWFIVTPIDELDTMNGLKNFVGLLGIVIIFRLVFAMIAFSFGW